MTTYARIYIGTYSIRGSAGIYHVEMDAGSGAMRVASQSPAFDASYLAFSPDRRTLYAVEEGVSEDHFTPAIAAYCVKGDASLEPLGRLPIAGLAPCHIAVSPDGRWLITSNYSDGSHTVVAVSSERGLDSRRTGELSHVVYQRSNVGEIGPHERQDAPHAHFAQFMDFGPDGWRVYSCDLGLDAVIVFGFDPESGSLELLPDECVALPPSAGPRHMAFHPTLPITYVFGELDSTIYAYRMTRGAAGSKTVGSLEFSQAVATLPAGYDGVSLGAAIRVSPDGGTVVVANRGRDSLAACRVDPETGLLEFIGDVSCGGEWPRDFAYVTPDLVVVANERSDTLAAFRVGEGGLPTAIDLPEARLAIPSPTCVAAAWQRA